MSNEVTQVNSEILLKIESELAKIEDKAKRKRVTRFILSVLSSIPWVGGFLSATASLNSEMEQNETNEIFKLWHQEHQTKIERLGQTIKEILIRFESFGEQINERLESEEYLQIVSKGFRIWDKSDTDMKREYIRKLLSNAVATNLCSDDVLRLFLDWIEKYHESYFFVIKYIYKTPGITRGKIWDQIYDHRPTENSSEADLYKMLIRELSMGGVIRQYRETNYYGEFVPKKTSARTKGPKKYKSAFDDEEPYELTQLGKQFVHYCMNEVVDQIEN